MWKEGVGDFCWLYTSLRYNHPPILESHRSSCQDHTLRQRMNKLTMQNHKLHSLVPTPSKRHLHTTTHQIQNNSHLDNTYHLIFTFASGIPTTLYALKLLKYINSLLALPQFNILLD